MREKFGIAISVIIALSLLYFIAPMDDLMTLFGRPQNVGEVAGKNVSYEDFQEQIEKYTTINEIMTGSSVQNEQSQKQIRDAAWQEFIDKYLFIKNAKAAGIKVGDAEMIELTTGASASPIIAQNPAFADETGAYSPDALIQFVQNVGQDQTGRLKTYWNYLQNTVYSQQFYSKFGAAFNGSAALNALMEESAIAENNTTFDVDYVVKTFGYEPDSTITVSNAEIKKYYTDHKKNYKQQASRDAEYVVFEVKPSSIDIAKATEEMDALVAEFASTDNVKNFLLKNSERSLSNYWYKAGELNTINREVNDFVFGAANGVSPVYKSGESFFAAKVMNTAQVPDSVYVKHILLQGADAKAKADSLLGVVKAGQSFSGLAAEFSADKGSAADGEMGNIGWMTQSYMIPGFESCITAEIGKPFILKTQYGTHVVIVSKKTAPVLKKQVAILEKTALASKETFNDFYAQANKFATIAGGTADGYKRAIDSTHVYSHPAYKVLEGQESYGSVDSAKEITRWIFDNKAGKASNIITVNNNYFFVVCVNKVRKEGYQDIEEVATQIKDMLSFQKQQEKAKAEVAEKIAGLGTLEEIATALGTTVTSREGLAFSSVNGPMAEPALLGAAYAAEEGKICGPVAGQMGIYVLQVKNRKTGEFFTAEDAQNYEKQKVQYASQMIIPAMMDYAEVKDNRARFF